MYVSSSCSAACWGEAGTVVVLEAVVDAVLVEVVVEVVVVEVVVVGGANVVVVV